MERFPQDRGEMRLHGLPRRRGPRGNRSGNARGGDTEAEAEKCAGCENCTRGKHEVKTAAEPAVKPKSHKKTKKGKKK